MKVFARIFLGFILTAVVLWLITTQLPNMVQIGNGYVGLAIVAGIFTLLNIILRPILRLITLPLRLFFGLIIALLINLLFVWITLQIVPSIGAQYVTFSLPGGSLAWLVIAIALGVIQVVLK